MSRVAIVALLLAASTALGQPVDSKKPPAGFVPPVLKGVRGDGTPRHANAPLPFPAENEQWLVAKSKHFTFISSAGERRTRELAANLETLAAALARFSPRLAATSDPTRVIVFSRRRESQPYFDMLLNRNAANVSGLFVSQRSGGSMLINESDSFRGGERTPFHELVHYLISNGGKHPPLWLEEGLAEYFSNAELRRSSIYAGLPVKQHVDTLRQRRLLPLRQLFAVQQESDTYNLPSSQALFYAESWAVVDWLMRNGGDDRSRFEAFLADVAQGTSPETALRLRYGRSLDDLNAAVSVFNRTTTPKFGFQIAVPTTDATVAIAPLDRAALLYELGRFLAGFEEMAPEAERHFRAALAENPNHARSLAALKRFDEAIAADPRDSGILLDYAESLLDKDIGELAQTNDVNADDAPRFRHARELAQKALDLGAPRARALGDFGATYIVEKDSDLAPGIAALEEAHRLAPSRSDYALHLFSMYRRLNDRAKADPLFRELEAFHNPQVAYASRAIIMRAGLSRADALLHEQKLNEAAAVMRGLAAESSADHEAAADLERQARDIDGVAQQNLEIGLYNKAIHEVNARDYAAARKTLAALLKSATDAGIIADARKLQQQLARARR